MTDIDDQVAAFAAQLDDLAAVEPQQILNDVDRLSTAIITAPDWLMASAEIRETLDRFPDDEDYAHGVILGAIIRLTLHLTLTADLSTLPGEEGLLRRLQAVASACRGLGIHTPGGAVFFGGV
ncbi:MULTISPECIES: hypothetical protein [unclassified Microbacterium]|uniref:hypothetical protein n=1 Tax=unclassified Microbacterium TaxID=2609290 RepID=UPI000C2B75FF|nr:MULTISPECIES: hypothetical protein [unclassified Microbacterium]